MPEIAGRSFDKDSRVREVSCGADRDFDFSHGGYREIWGVVQREWYSIRWELANNHRAQSQKRRTGNPSSRPQREASEAGGNTWRIEQEDCRKHRTLYKNDIADFRTQSQALVETRSSGSRRAKSSPESCSTVWWNHCKASWWFQISIHKDIWKHNSWGRACTRDWQIEATERLIHTVISYEWSTTVAEGNPWETTQGRLPRECWTLQRVPKTEERVERRLPMSEQTQIEWRLYELCNQRAD